jgi:uncharacterized membrane protein YbhN (UPF0104 family)
LKEALGDAMTEYWFKPKRYGYGATPVTWQGWASSLAAAVALLIVFRFFLFPIPGAAAHPLWEVGLGVVVAAAVVAVFNSFAKSKTDGEWHWRWGKNSN